MEGICLASTWSVWTLLSFYLPNFDGKWTRVATPVWKEHGGNMLGSLISGHQESNQDQRRCWGWGKSGRDITGEDDACYLWLWIQLQWWELSVPLIILIFLWGFSIWERQSKPTSHASTNDCSSYKTWAECTDKWFEDLKSKLQVGWGRRPDFRT